MKQYSFLKESKSKLLKRLSRYKPEEIAKIREKMISLGKQNGGWYSPSEYGDKMIRGQVKRIKNFKPAGGKHIVKFTDVPMLDSNTATNYQHNTNTLNSTIGLPRSTKNFEIPQDPIYKKRWLLAKQKYENDPEGVKLLTMGDVYSHEADELTLGVKNWLRWNKKHPGKELTLWDYIQMICNTTKDSTGRHNTGVLKREAKRNHLLSQLYGKDSKFYVDRSQKSYSMNKKYPTLDNYDTFNTDWDLQ